MKPIELINEFFQSLILHFEGDPSILYLQKSNFFEKHHIPGYLNGHNESNNEKSLKILNNISHTKSSISDSTPSGKFDVVVGDFPIINDMGKPKEINDTIEAVNSISETGVGIFFLSFGRNFLGKFDLHQELKNSGFFINAIFNLPNNFWNSTAIRPVLVIISKTSTPEIVIAEFESWEGNQHGQYDQLLLKTFSLITSWEEFLEENPTVNISDITIENKEINNDIDDTEDLWNGLLIKPGDFYGFEHLHIQNSLAYLSSDFKNFQRIKLEHLIKKAKTGKYNEKFSEVKGAIYIPLLGTSRVVSKISEITIKHQNCVEIIVDSSKVIPEYLAIYLNSDLGKLIISLEKTKELQIIPKLNQSRIKNIDIALPDMVKQQEIVDSFHKLETLTEKFLQLKNSISKNPDTSSDLERLDIILDAVGELSNVDKINALIRNGESKTVEFKQTLSFDVKTRKKEKWIEKSLLKTLVGFLNSDGGNLLIGVDDNQTLTGINQEVVKLHQSNNDNFLKHLKNIVKTSIGPEHYPLINNEVIKIGSKDICRITCSKSSKEVYLDNTEFYVRTNPSTDKLEGPKLVEYIKNRFL